ncbi:hypothetical protein [Mycobacterium sp. NPDC050041]|uniref:hypothetical protein n=1 Tax=Mycobacterium sp. NPDC050041 TaxID=3364293 RepID=UPI003C2F1368
MAAVSAKLVMTAVVAVLLAACSETSTPAPSTSATSSVDSAERDAAARRQESAVKAGKDPANYRPLTDREFALIAKDPDASKGERVIVYGTVTQFDAATGTTDFRAETGALPPDQTDSYSQNAFISAGPNPNAVKDVVKGDRLKMFVEVSGDWTYNTTLGGAVTVPRFALWIVENLGPAS